MSGLSLAEAIVVIAGPLVALYFLARIVVALEEIRDELRKRPYDQGPRNHRDQPPF